MVRTSTIPSRQPTDSYICLTRKRNSASFLDGSRCAIYFHTPLPEWGVLSWRVLWQHEHGRGWRRRGQVRRPFPDCSWRFLIQCDKCRCVNIPWSGPGATDADYLYAFQRVVMPIAYEFSPDFVISRFKW